MLARMGVEERVGQLFIVPFVGPDVGDNSNIAELIVEYKVGGVVLLAANQNFANDESTPSQVATLANQLQNLVLAHSTVPLLVAIDHEGDGWPYTRITGGVTPLPSPMAVGATWDPEKAEAIGEITGLAAIRSGWGQWAGPISVVSIGEAMDEWLPWPSTFPVMGAAIVCLTMKWPPWTNR
jgi:beta-N-acetylhexosaminidase